MKTYFFNLRIIVDTATLKAVSNFLTDNDYSFDAYTDIDNYKRGYIGSTFVLTVADTERARVRHAWLRVTEIIDATPNQFHAVIAKSDRDLLSPN